MDLTNTEYPIFLKENLRFLRKEGGLSQDQLARHIGLKRSNIASYENGTAEPRICNLLKLATYFGVSMIDLTQTDLVSSDHPRKALSSRIAFNDEDMEVVREFKDQADESKAMLKGLHCLNKARQVDLSTLPKEFQHLIINFEQLYEVSDQLLCNHLAILDFVKGKYLENENGQ